MALCFIQNLTISAGTRFCKIVTSHFSWNEFCKEMLWSRHQIILLYAYYAHNSCSFGFAYINPVFICPTKLKIIKESK